MRVGDALLHSTRRRITWRQRVRDGPSNGQFYVLLPLVGYMGTASYFSTGTMTIAGAAMTA